MEARRTTMHGLDGATSITTEIIPLSPQPSLATPHNTCTHSGSLVLQTGKNRMKDIDRTVLGSIRSPLRVLDEWHGRHELFQHLTSDR